MSGEQRNDVFSHASSDGWETYRQSSDDVVSNLSRTIGIVDTSGEGWGDMEWMSAFCPEIMEDWVQLIRFCYPGRRSIAFGFLHAPDDGEQPPALIAGLPGEDRVISLAPRREIPTTEGDDDE